MPIPRDELARANRDLATADILTILRWANDTFPDNIAMTTAFGYSGLVLLHHAIQVIPDMPVYFIDTGWHFPETLEFCERLQSEWDLNLKTVTPAMPKDRLLEEVGPKPYNSNPDLCCHHCKVEPLLRFIHTSTAWLSGIRRDQIKTRAGLEIVEIDGRGVVQISPMANWTREQAWSYIRQHELPYHPLHDRGYSSVGCAPCILPDTAGGDERDARWPFMMKLDSGILLVDEEDTVTERPRILVTSPIAEDAVERLGKRCDVDVIKITEEEELIETIPEYHGVIVRSKPKVTRAVIEAAPKLKVIARAGVGLDNIDLETAEKRGIEVVNSPAASTASAAELVFAHILAFTRQVTRADASLKSNKWIKSRLRGFEMSGKTIGIVGCGRIGGHAAKIARGFGMDVLAYDEVCTDELVEGFDVEYTDLVDLLRRSDIISLHVPLTDSTRYLISTEEFKLMKKSAILVNIARGGVVDEKALYNALVAGEIYGACLDVFETEPPYDNPLLTLDNVLVTPHLGASTEEAQQKAGKIIAEAILRIV